MTRFLKMSLICIGMLAFAACDTGSSTAGAGSANSTPAVPGKDWSTTIVATAEGGYRMGNPDAQVKLVEFGSFTCPHCRDFYVEGAAKLEQDYVKSGKVSYEFRSFLLNPYDFVATALAVCEGDQRVFFWINQLYSSFDSWIEPFTKLTDADIEPLKAMAPGLQVKELAVLGGVNKFARTRGLPGAKFDACLTDQSLFDTLQTNQNATMKQYDIQGTPTFLLNGKKVDNVTTWAQLEPKIREALS